MNEGDNSKKYFSIKVGCSALLGVPLEVDMNKLPENRIRALTGPYEIKYLYAGEYSTYALMEKNEPLLHLIIGGEGELKIASNKNWAATLNPIDEKRANDLVERIREAKLPSWIKDSIGG